MGAGGGDGIFLAEMEAVAAPAAGAAVASVGTTETGAAVACNSVLGVVFAFGVAASLLLPQSCLGTRSSGEGGLHPKLLFTRIVTVYCISPSTPAAVYSKGAFPARPTRKLFRPLSGGEKVSSADFTGHDDAGSAHERTARAAPLFTSVGAGGAAGSPTVF